MSSTRYRDAFAELNEPAFLSRLRSDEGARAFARLVGLTHDPLFAFVRRHFRSREDCHEIVQETYLAVHRGLNGFQGNSRLTTWIYGLAYHKICDRIAVRVRRAAEVSEPFEGDEGPAPSEEAWSRITAWEVSADRMLDKKRAEVLIAEAVGGLVPPGSEVYHLRDVEGLSGEEVAEILGISAGNVRILLHRARRQIVEWVRNKMATGPTYAGGEA
jgi:RNA polymerase sigma-70 factor (ECF subfamily)